MKLLKSFKKVTVKDVLEDPHSYGMPTFQEFAKNRERYMGREDDVLSSVDAGGILLKNRTKRIKYQVKGYRCDTLEEVERVCRDEGMLLKDLQYMGFIEPQNGFDCDILIKFMTKEEFEQRRAVEKAERSAGRRPGNQS